jgi:uncharacterized protein YaaN involved in tellurite resistance
MITKDELKTVATEMSPDKASLAYPDAPPAEREHIEALMAEIDLNDSHSILYFGAHAQQRFTSLSEDMLEGVRSKDTGAAGEALNEMVGALRGFDPGAFDPSRKPGLLARLLGRAKPVVQFLQRYEEVRRQIDTVGDELERHKTQLLTDIASLDRLYRANLDYFRALERYITAGEEGLRRLDEEEIPALERRASQSGELLDAQHLRDLRAARDNLERRVHDLRLTRQVAMQSLPSIRLVQDNDKALVNKIISTTTNTLPLWRQQLAQALTIQRSREAAQSIRAASDLTNELLAANAENLKQGNAEARREVERGVFDIEAVKRANAALIETIEDSLHIADEGRRKRAEALAQLDAMEAQLRNTLAGARANPPSEGRS